MKKDKYQKRYEAHQNRKKELLNLLSDRVSQRIFNDKPVSIEQVDDICVAMAKAPSSCNRQAVYAVRVMDRTRKELLGSLLVGGVGWAHKASCILVLFAGRKAYKAQGELRYMPYLDAGVAVQNAYLFCEAMGIGVCFINPNVRKENWHIFNNRFKDRDNDIFCGALAIGHYDKKAKVIPKKKDITIK